MAVIAAGVCLIGSGCSGSRRETPRATYDPATGLLRTLTFDANGNGTNESTAFMNGGRIVRAELDFDENGKVDRWDLYRADGSLDKVGFASRNDGVMDAMAYYEPAGVLARMEVSTRHDGFFNRTEFYEGGVLVRTAEDTNRDHAPDKWETYRPRTGAGPNEPAYGITSTSFDDIGSGTPQRRFVYGPQGTVVRVDVLPGGSGAEARTAAARER